MPDEPKELPPFPERLSLKDLENTHECYRPDLIRKFEDFYEGGERFEAHKDQYVRVKNIEKTQGGRAIRQTRLDSASYTPHVAGLIDFLVSACIQSEPSILATGPEEKTAYYHNLNTDADGMGTDLSAIVRQQLLEVMKHHRSYFSVCFQDDEVEYNDPGQQREAGVLDADISGLNACCVDDWEEDEDERLLWVRTHRITKTRSRQYGPTDLEVHTWTYITPDWIAEYQATRKIDQKVWPKDALAFRIALKPGCGFLPVIPIKVPSGMWVMNRLFPIALSLFNREASEDYALDSSAFALPVVKTKKDLKSIVGSEVSVLKLDPEDSFEWATPPSDHFTALADSAERKKEGLFLAVQAMGLQTSSKDSQGRQSGAAKRYDAAMIAVLLSAFAAALRDALEQTVRLIQQVREDDDVTISITGLDRFDVSNVELLLRQVSEFIALPGSPTAQRWSIQKLSLAMCSDAPADEREKIRTECQQINMTETQPKPGNPIRVNTTHEVEGFGSQNLGLENDG